MALLTSLQVCKSASLQSASVAHRKDTSEKEGGFIMQ